MIVVTGLIFRFRERIALEVLVWVERRDRQMMEKHKHRSLSEILSESFLHEYDTRTDVHFFSIDIQIEMKRCERRGAAERD